jgi:hypothetical protein
VNHKIIAVPINEEQKRAILDIYLRTKNRLPELEDVAGEYGWPILEELEELGLIRIQRFSGGLEFFLTGRGNQLVQ